MTSVLLEEESNVTRLKQKSQTHAGHMGKPGSDESRSFLSFSRENLCISSSDLDQELARPSRLPRACSRQTLLSCAALILSLSCAALELWKLRCVLANARDIEALGRDVEALKHRLLEKDLLDELKAFEEQLYGEGASEEDEANSSSGALSSDYDSSYDDKFSASGDYPTVTYEPAGLSSSPGPASAPPPSTTTMTPCTSKDLEGVLAVLRRAESERGRDFEHSVARGRERQLDEERVREHQRFLEAHRLPSADGPRRKRAVFYTRLKISPNE